MNLHHVNDALWNAGSKQEASLDIPYEASVAELEFEENQVRGDDWWWRLLSNCLL